MLYQRSNWTLPAANPKTSQENWDRAFLSKAEFEVKYPGKTY